MKTNRRIAAAIACAVLVAMAAAGFYWYASRTSEPGFDKLVGRWLRPDGSYVVDIRSVAKDGTMDAAYFNPRPIRVAKAQALGGDGRLGVFIELRDVNYPGSTYQLTYDPATDCLNGTYYQALHKETYIIYFVRMKP